MSQVINTNLPSLNAQRNLNTTNSQLSQSIQRLSSGLRVNSAKDDAAGLAIAERMNSQIRGFNVAIRNANDGISLAQVAEGAVGKVGEMAQRMRELATQAANATNGDGDRANLDNEFQQLAREILRTLTAIDIPENVGDFRLIDRVALDTFRAMPERDRFVRGLVERAGAKERLLSSAPRADPPRASSPTLAVSNPLHRGRDKT